MVDKYSNQRVEEGIDLELAFSESPVSDEQVANWYLVKQDGEGGVETVLFLNVAKRKPKSFYFQVADALSQIGGFIVFIYLFYGLFVRFYNNKFFLVNMI